MEIIPRLYLTNNTKNIPNGSVVSANNITLNNNNLLQVGYGYIENDVINECIKNKCNDKNYEIKHCVECPEELIIFVKIEDYDSLLIFRYSEKENKCIYIIDNFEYNGGKLISTYTYNKNNLIIAISEYSDNDELNIPLRVLNLGEFYKNNTSILPYELINNKLHSINPEIIIPTINHEFINGNSYKGWHHIFIRYKISDETYTKWFCTNHSIYLDNFSIDTVSNYTVHLYDESNNGFNYNSWMTQSLSDTQDVCNNSYKLTINNLDTNYTIYQIGIFIISKNNNKTLYSEDLSISNISNIVTFHNFKDYNNNDLLDSYNNYYNIKYLESFNNKLYISNYLEKNENINVDDITISMSGVLKDADNYVDNDTDGEDPEIPESIYAKYIGCTDTVDGTPMKDIIVQKYNIKLNNADHDYFASSAIRYNYNKSNNKKYFLDVLSYDGPHSDIINQPDIYLIIDLYKLSGDGASTTYIKKGHYILKTKIYNLCIIKNCDYIYGKFSSIKKLSIYLKYVNNIIAPWTRYFNEPTREDYGVHPNIKPEITLMTQEEFDENIKNVIDYDITFNTFEDSVSNSAIIHSVIDYKNENYKENLLDCDWKSWDWNYIKKDNDDIIDTNTSIIHINNLNKFGIDINEYYSFYIHFINKYGETSRGIQLSKFNIELNNNELTSDEEEIIIKSVTNNKGKTLIYFKDENELTTIKDYEKDKILLLKTKINKFPKNYIGYFITYEKIDKRIYYKGFGKYVSNTNYNFEFYSDKFNFDDKINLNFNKIATLNFASTQFNVSIQGSSNKILTYDETSDLTSYLIKDKKLSPANSIDYGLDNYINSTKLRLLIDNISSHTNLIFCLLYNDNVFDKYMDDNILIPCSNICYNNNENLIINTKNAINTNITYLYYYGDIYFDSANLKFIDSTGNNKKIVHPYFLLQYNYYDDLPYESLSYKNKPDTKMFFSGVNANTNTNIYKKGSIIELKNTIDLYQQRQLPYYESTITVYDYNKDYKKYINKFTNTIRRSEQIFDESYENNWRKFNINIYKNVSENKGDIIKIENINNSMIIHTKYGLFILDGSDSIKSFNNGKIQLASIDIWDINIKELVSSKLGYGGLENSKLSVSGEYGYIWYSDYELFLMNNNFQIKKITDDIKDLLGDGENNIKIDSLFNDKKNNTILINFVDKDKSLTYNYKSNTFISFVDKLYDKVYNTKSNTYIINNNKLFNYDLNNNISKLNNKRSSISIIFNENYDKIKILENIIYKIKNKIINDINDIIYPKWLQNDIQYYAGDKIRIFSQFADTDYINIILSDDEINKENSTKPYWHLGNWNFNNIRNKIKNNEINLNLNDNEQSLIYGNYFIVTFVFESNNLIQIESIDFNTKLI